MADLSTPAPTMHCPHGCVECTTCESSYAARELRALRKVAEAALRVYHAWDQDLHHVNKMFALGRELRDAGFELKQEKKNELVGDPSDTHHLAVDERAGPTTWERTACGTARRASTSMVRDPAKVNCGRCKRSRFFAPACAAHRVGETTEKSDG